MVWTGRLRVSVGFGYRRFASVWLGTRLASVDFGFSAPGFCRPVLVIGPGVFGIRFCRLRVLFAPGLFGPGSVRHGFCLVSVSPERRHSRESHHFGNRNDRTRWPARGVYAEVKNNGENQPHTIVHPIYLPAHHAFRPPSPQDTPSQPHRPPPSHAAPPAPPFPAATSSSQQRGFLPTIAGHFPWQ